MADKEMNVNVTLASDAEREAEKLKTELKELKTKNRQAEREKQKQLKLLAEQARMATDAEVWKEVTQIKEMVNKQLKANKITQRYNIKDISAMPDFYTYQNPNNKKLKTNDKDADWIKEYLAGGGTEKILLETAAASRVSVWKKIKFKRTANKSTAAAPAPKAKPSKVSGGVG